MFERVFGKARKSAQSADYFKTLTAYQPVFRSWNGKLYESELVRSAIDARSRHISKLHVHIEGSANPRLQSRMKNAPMDRCMVEPRCDGRMMKTSIPSLPVRRIRRE